MPTVAFMFGDEGGFVAAADNLASATSPTGYTPHPRHEVTIELITQ